MRDHAKLRAFVLADEVAIFTYRETKNFPKDEMYGLTRSLRSPNRLQSKQPE